MLWGCVAFGQLLYGGVRTETDAPQRSARARAMKLVGLLRFDSEAANRKGRSEGCGLGITRQRKSEPAAPCAALFGLRGGGAVIVRPGRQWLRIELGRGSRAAAAPLGFLRGLLGSLLTRF